MISVGKYKLLLAILLIGIVAGYLAFTMTGQSLRDHPNTTNVPSKEARQETVTAPSEEVKQAAFEDTDFDKVIPKSFPRQISRWEESQKTTFQDILAKGSYDLMVLPFQVFGPALDRPTRSLMTADLTYTIAKETSLKLPDPYLLARALGEGELRYSYEEINNLASRIGVKEVVWTYVSYTPDHQMVLVIEKLKPGQYPVATQNNELGNRVRFQKSFTDEIPPIEIFHKFVPELISKLGIEAGAKDQGDAEAPAKNIFVPANPMDMFLGGPDDHVRNAYYFQFLAYLAPEYSERARERLIEKSLLEIYQIAETNPRYKALKARAYMQLGLRPAAISLLGKPGDKEEEALLAALNGNLTDLRNLMPAIPSGMGLILAEFDQNRIASNYNLQNSQESIKAANSLQLAGDIWPFLAKRAMTDWDIWAQFDNSSYKLLLDREFPIPGYSLKSMITGAKALGESSKIRSIVDLSVYEHINMLRKKTPDIWCCKTLSLKPGAADYLDLIEAIATDNLMHRAYYLFGVQGNPERALEFLDTIAPVYEGYPQYALYRAKTKKDLANDKQGAEAEGLLRSGYLDVNNALFWAKGQTRVAAKAFLMILRFNRHDYGRYSNNPYGSDYPYRSFYPDWDSGGRPIVTVKHLSDALKNSTNDFWPVIALEQQLSMSGRPQRFQEIVDLIQGRFNGNPQYFSFMAEHWERLGQREKAKNNYRKGIEAIPGVWNNYSHLGAMLFSDGQIEDAFNLYMSWPRFRANSNTNPVEISNSAYEAGSYFYWSGLFKEGAALYKIAADLNTGSYASMASKTRLHILNGEYDLAKEESLLRARRYNSSYAYRDYLGMLFATGKDMEAWGAFDMLINRQPGPHVWESALVGHHRESASESDIVKWVQKYKDMKSEEGRSYAAIYLLRSGVMDRVPSEELAKQIEQIDSPIWQPPSQWESVFRYSSDRVKRYIVGRRTLPEGLVMPIGMSPMKERLLPVKSHLAYYAEAYRALHADQYDIAADRLKKAVEIYNMGDPEFSYLLPYYAYASARIKQVSDVEAVLKMFPPELQKFDYHLAKAVLAGIAGDYSASNKHLDLALYRRPHTEFRALFTEYQYAELCELLYKATGNIEYKKRLLDWSKKAKRIFPWNSWPYEMIAKYSDDPVEKGKAIAVGFYLDKNSERLRSIPKSEIQASVKSYGYLNPFLQKTKTESERQQI